MSLPAAFPPPPASVLPPSPSTPASAPAAPTKPFRDPGGLRPILRFGGLRPKSGGADGRGWLWTGSVLTSAPYDSPAPTLVLFTPPEAAAARASAPAVLVTSYGGWSYYRFDLAVDLGPAAQAIEYAVGGSTVPVETRFRFFVPAAGEDANTAFWTCNGFGEGLKPGVESQLGGIQPMWRDLLKRHQERPFHVQIGGGDQLYADGYSHSVFEDGSILGKWLQTGDINDRANVEWTSEFEQAVGDFYYLAYIYHFQEEVFSEALATIPYAFVCDDHDIFDGYGSYPPDTMDAPVIRNTGRLAYKFYLLFQHHTSFAEAGALDLFPAPAGFSWLKRLGPTVAALAIDNRSQRTEDRIVPEACMDEIWRRLDELASEAESDAPRLRHLVVVATVPVVYPRMTLAGRVMDIVASMAKSFRYIVRIGTPSWLYRDALLREQSNPEINRTQITERDAMVRQLQEYAQRHLVRVTFVS
ncbi:hypothetical protein HK405_013160, partial [Cladochytrium tenue]